ncbi:hypothetical protein ACHWQZ_G001505 [Mnemiopsis leidyi]
MLTALLIGLACTQALFALAPPSAGGVECYANRRVYQAGESYSMGCETCTCGGDGEVDCTENTKCCLYIRNGITTTADIGEEYHNGCCHCTCTETENGEVSPDCHDENVCRSCRFTCPYLSADLVQGFAQKGETVQAWDEEGDGITEGGCIKSCTCRSKNKLKCGNNCLVGALGA